MALHAASDKNPAGKVELGFGVEDVEAFHREASAAGIPFTQAPKSEHGATLATFLDCEGAQVSVSS